MKINRKSYRDGNLYPEVFNYLKVLPDNVLFHADYTERHPFSIYALSMQRVMKAFAAILSELDEVHAALLDVNGNLSYRLHNLPELQRELLSALQAHIDDCFRILKTLHPPTTTSKTRFVKTWLKEAKHPTYKSFQQNIGNYRDLVDPLINKIKHNGSQIRPIVMYSRGRTFVTQDLRNGIKTFPQNIRIVGYFLEGMQSDGCIGPDVEFHPGGNTAISLNRDLRFHFANLYRISRHLKSAITKAVRKTHNIDLPYPGIIKPNDYHQDLEQVAKQISCLPSLFFENEFLKSTPDVKYFCDTRSPELVLEFPSARKVVWQGDVAFYGEIQVDHISLKYRIPYMNS